MPKQKTITTYQYSELSDTAKERAAAWFLEAVGFDDNQFTFQDMQEDARQVGIKLTEWDYCRYAKGGFVTSARTCAKDIIGNHGEACETYKTAAAFLKESADLYAMQDADKIGIADADRLEEMEREFLDSILEDYRILMDKDADYRQSEEYMVEMMEANEYEFDENGRRV